MARRRRLPDRNGVREPSASPGDVPWLVVRGASHNNLKNLDVYFPLGRFIAVTGVSGSGKSSLVNDILRDALARDLNGANTTPGAHRALEGFEPLDKVIDIDQSPIGRTPRSNPATYIKVFDRIRNLYAELPEAKVRGYSPGRFSFNVSGGRCEACEGNGSNRLEMDFLADVWVTCPVCEGKRFNRETLQIRFKDKSIHDVLEMDVQEGLEHFANLPAIRSMLQTLHDVGLDYLKLGQPSPTLSGGEAQRIKLARELCRKSTGRTLYVLDEPTTGLHFDDIHKLLQVLHGFVDAGNTVIVIEHNLDVIKTADWIIDLGPEGGEEGGRLVACGTPEEVAECPESYTGQALRAALAPKRGGKRTGRRRSAPLAAATATTHLVVEGARQHNLKDVNLALPLKQVSVLCGPSGSGKSSLAIDTLYAEGQRRYVESLSSYARQFLGQMQKPAVERITGLAPAICIEQKAASKSPRSTVGTVTEIYDYLRVLMARVGQPYCPRCQIPVGTQTSEEIIDKLLQLAEGTRVYLMAPIEATQFDSYDALWKDLQRSGFVRMRVDGVTYEMASPPTVDRRRRHVVEVIVDRTVIRHHQRSRIADAVEAALDFGRGVLHVAHVEDGVDERKWRLDRYSQHFACERCGRSFVELTPNHFSFNSPIGWCPACEGLGVQAGGGESVWSDSARASIRAGGVKMWSTLYGHDESFTQALEAVARHAGFSLDEPVVDFSPEAKRALFHGTGDAWIDLDDGYGTQIQYKGVIPAMSEAARLSWVYRGRLADLVGESACSTCQGTRLRDDAAAVRLGDRTIGQWTALPLVECLRELDRMSLSPTQRHIAAELLREIRTRLEFLVDVGLGYLTLARATPTLSGGEAQRIRLASQLGSGLTGVLYILDEPTIGLHPRDNHRLLAALRKLRGLGNTVVMVEHDREVIDAADRLVDFGPGAGRQGGHVVAQGSPDELRRSADSLTGRYLAGVEAIAIPKERRPTCGPRLEVVGAAHHNLKRITVGFPLGTLIAVTGVSGSGKSSLVSDILWAALARRLHRAALTPGLHEEIRGIDQIDKVINVDQQPIGNTPASNPATYTGAFDLIRELFAKLPAAKVRGYSAGRFSFNKPGGRCEACEGNGQKKIEMHFLPDVWVDCDICKGSRYAPETLAVKFQGRSIADVLTLSVGEARDLFQNIPKIRAVLETLCDVGLDYLALGQSAPTLSGGEAQRVKLAAELARPNTGKTLYILDEPTTGLHFDDIRKLLLVLHRLVDLGNTVICIEHNLDLIKTADWVIDLGPEAGEAGGEVLFEGTPDELVARWLEAQADRGATARPFLSHTAQALAPVWQQGPFVDRPKATKEAPPPGTQLDLFADVEIADAKLPWEVDGPQWHLVDRIARNGKPAKWDGDALRWLVERLKGHPALGPVNWADQRLVEIAAKTKSHGWFLHALTGEEWLLWLKFRPAKGTFKSELLARQLNLRPLNELKEVPLYGSEPRVRVRMLRNHFQEVELSVFRAAEIQTPAFERFLEKAVDSFAKAVERSTTQPEAAAPWMTEGREWHFSTKGFRPGKRVHWDRDAMPKLLRCLEAASPNGLWDWQSRDSVKRRFPGIGQAWARVMTKHHRSLELHLVGPKGRFNLAAFDQFGVDRQLRNHVERFDAIRIDFQSPDDFSELRLVEFLTEHAESFREAFGNATAAE